MAIEELSQKYFTRERVRNRMLKRAAEVWGFPESEMDDFDPLVNLLIEACSVEFEKISGEIGKTQNRMLERLAQLLHPGMIDVNPAYGMMQARSAEPSAILNPDAQFFYKPAGSDRKRENQHADLFFSPSRPTKVFDGNVVYISSARELYSISDGIQKLQIASSAKKIMDFQHTVWLGLDLNEELNSLDEVSFFISWMNQPEAENWYQYLPYTEWLTESGRLEHQSGFPVLENDAAPAPAPGLEEEFDPMRKIETQVNKLYSRHYVTINATVSADLLKIKRRPYPKELEQFFDKPSIQGLKDSLVWIEIRFPAVVPAEALDTIFISMNAVPVINRKLNKFSYKLAQNLNIVPLETDGAFLSMKEITNSLGQPVKLIPFANPSGLKPETYTLRYGVNRFDERNAHETLVNLTELIREESSFFSSLGEDFLIQHIRELNQVLARIEERVKMRSKNQSSYPYLAVKPGREAGNIGVEFWSCNGEAANRIPIGSRLNSYRSSNILTNAIFFISSTYGGKDKFNDAEKIDLYKKSVLTHNRIVTLEDLSVFMQTELGNTAKSIGYKKIYIKSRNPGDGFVRCMQILITPAPGGLELHEWEQRLRDIQLKLEKQSVNNIPYQLNLATA